MKKLYTLSFLLLASVMFGQSVVITRVVDGTLPSDGCDGSSGSSNPKVVELYVSGTVDLSYYRVQTESNGAVDEASISWSSGTYLNDLGTVTDDFVYLVYNSSETTFTEMWPGIVDHVLISANAPNGNGNDCLRVVEYSMPSPDGELVSVIDQFGNPLQIVDGSGDYSAVWAYNDSYAARVDNTAANGGFFDSTTFTYGGSANFAAPNNNCAYIINAVELGTYVAGTNSLAQNSIDGLKIYPNPLSGNILNITSNNNAAKNVAIFDVLGKNVINTVVTNGTLNASALSAGVYVVKITEEGKTATRKLVVK